MTTLEILKGARELLSDPARWTQGAAARDKNGFVIDIDEISERRADVARVSINGAIELVDPDRSLEDEELSELFGLPEEVNVLDWEDVQGRTHAEVLARFDEAIARLEVQS
jgi:hypothetical protein